MKDLRKTFVIAKIPFKKQDYQKSKIPQSDLGRRADSRWALPQISSFICHHHHHHMFFNDS